MEDSDQIHNLHLYRRYRRYRIVGLLPAVVILAGGFYLGVADGSWIPLLAGVLFLLVCALMIASDHQGASIQEDKHEDKEVVPVGASQDGASTLAEQTRQWPLQ